MKRKEKANQSLFGYYVRAAFIAARMNITLEHAFKMYVKPYIPSEGVRSFTDQELKELKDHF